MKAHLRLSQLFLGLMCVFFQLTGCGGGTTGTDGGTTRLLIVGNASFASGQPLNGADVVVLETGNRTVADSKGNFEIPDVPVRDRATLLIAYRGDEVRTEPVAVQQDSAVVVFDVTVTEGSAGLEIVSVSVTPLNDADIAPTPAPVRPEVSSPFPAPRAKPTAPARNSPTPTPPTDTAKGPKAHIVEGLVIDTNDAPVPGVRASYVGGFYSSESETNTNGRFILSVPVTASSLDIYLFHRLFGGKVSVSSLPKVPSRIRVTIRVVQPGGGTSDPDGPQGVESELEPELEKVESEPLAVSDR